MPRRIYTYEPGRGWEIWNLIARSACSFRRRASLAWWAIVMSVVLKGEDCRPKRSLGRLDARMGHVTSPPPEYNFETLPEVREPPPISGI